MNDKIKQLAIQAGLTCTQDGWVSTQKKHAEGVEDEYLERFAELVRADEREACAKLLDDFSKTNMVPAKDTWRYGVMMAANCVRDKK
jgi:hypothetical protein